MSARERKKEIIKDHVYDHGWPVSSQYYYDEETPWRFETDLIPELDLEELEQTNPELAQELRDQAQREALEAEAHRNWQEEQEYARQYGQRLFLPPAHARRYVDQPIRRQFRRERTQDKQAKKPRKGQVAQIRNYFEDRTIPMAPGVPYSRPSRQRYSQQ